MNPQQQQTIARLQEAVEAPNLTPGPWSWWTSCSFRRLSSDATGKDGDVLYGAVQKHDNHGDIQATQATMDFIAAANPTAIRSLLNLLREQEAEIARKTKALEDALSACSSVSMSRHRKVVIGDCDMYAQTDEWCKWVDEEIQPVIRAALTPEGR